MSQTPSNPEEERAFLFSNVSTILRCVEDFRRTGNLSGDLGPMFDLRTGPDAEASRAYQAQARARAAAHDAAHPARACAECGVFAVLRSCATCGRVAFCSKTCQRRAWKSWHKAECKALAAGVESNPPAEASALVTMPAEMVNELKASLALHIEELVALNPHPSHGAVTTMVEVHPAVTAILLHELGQATRQRKVTLSPHKLLELLPSLSKTVHPVATGDYGEIIVARGQDPRDAVYVWAGFMSVDVIPPSSSRNLELKIITRAVGEGKPEMHPEGERVFDAYLECATVRALEAWRERKKRETMDRIFEMVTGRMLG